MNLAHFNIAFSFLSQPSGEDGHAVGCSPDDVYGVERPCWSTANEDHRSKQHSLNTKALECYT